MKLKSRLIYVDENKIQKKENDNSNEKTNEIGGLELIEKVATTSNRILNSSNQVGNVIASLMAIRPQTYIDWNSFVKWVGLSFMAGFLLGWLIQKK
mgnify:CR=1 FL=1